MTLERSASNRIPAEERRQEILSSATDLFAAKGFDQTTMDDIATAANITKRTLYRYVASKEELLFEIHDSFTGQQMLADEPLGGDPIRDISAFVHRHIRMVANHPKAIGVFFEERKHLTGDQASRIEERRDAYEAVAVSIIQAAVDHGTFANIDPRVAAQALLGTMTEMYIWYRPEGPLTVPKIADLTVDFFLRGAATDRQWNFPEWTRRCTLRSATTNRFGAPASARGDPSQFCSLRLPCDLDAGSG